MFLKERSKKISVDLGVYGEVVDYSGRWGRFRKKLRGVGRNRRVVMVIKILI